MMVLLVLGEKYWRARKYFRGCDPLQGKSSSETQPYCPSCLPAREMRWFKGLTPDPRSGNILSKLNQDKKVISYHQTQHSASSLRSLERAGSVQVKLWVIVRLQRSGPGNERDDDNFSAGSQKISQLESCFFWLIVRSREKVLEERSIVLSVHPGRGQGN